MRASRKAGNSVQQIDSILRFYILFYGFRASFNECRKTKTKVITLANQKDGDNPLNQSRHEVSTRSRHKARENVHAQATIGFAFTSDWLKKWRENFEPITE